MGFNKISSELLQYPNLSFASFVRWHFAEMKYLYSKGKAILDCSLKKYKFVVLYNC